MGVDSGHCSCKEFRILVGLTNELVLLRERRIQRQRQLHGIQAIRALWRAADRPWAYLAALDVHRAKVFGRCETSTGIEPFARLVAQVMAQPPYRDARRVFWIMDNGSSHRGQPCVRRLTKAFPNLVPVHGPVHASWLNQIEIYFSIVQRKALTPNDFSCIKEVEDRLLRFQQYYESMATPPSIGDSRETTSQG